MVRQIEDQQKISLLIAAVVLFILVSMIGFGSAVVLSVVRLQADIQSAYIRPFAVSNAGLEAHATLSRLHNDMIRVILVNDPAIVQQLDLEMLGMDEKLRKEIAIIKAELPEDMEEAVEIERLLGDWKSMRAQLIGMVRQGRRDSALKLAVGGAAQMYSRLETKMSNIVSSAQHHAEATVIDAKTRAARIIRTVWWLLGGLVGSGILFGIMVIRKASAILKRTKNVVQKLYESEERMKLALSGADEGTWDLDIVTGRLSFDSQWGAILEFTAEQDRPRYFEDWSMLLHAEDKERVLKAMQDHVEGHTPEYKAEYRMHLRSGALKWVIGHGKAVSRDYDGRALRIVGVTRDITMKKQAEDKVWQLAHFDSLTGLPNRASFYDSLKQSVSQSTRHKRKLALLFLDLDGFKQVNDQFGHDAGDELLKGVAERLRKNIRCEDVVARIGGDEFIFILNDLPEVRNAGIAAQKIINSLVAPFLIQGNVCRIGCSIGISIFPDDTDNMEVLVTRADDAMYKAKEMGRNNFQFFMRPPPT